MLAAETPAAAGRLWINAHRPTFAPQLKMKEQARRLGSIEERVTATERSGARLGWRNISVPSRSSSAAGRRYLDWRQSPGMASAWVQLQWEGRNKYICFTLFLVKSRENGSNSPETLKRPLSSSTESFLLPLIHLTW